MKMRRIKATLTFKEENYVEMSQISGLFYDIELMHDLALFASDPIYDKVNLSHFYYRHGRPLKKHHKLRVGKISKSSPLTIELVFGGVVALVAIVQAFEIISNYKLKRQQLENEVTLQNIQIEQAMSEKGLLEDYKNIQRRLKKNSIRLTQIDEVEAIDFDDL